MGSHIPLPLPASFTDALGELYRHVRSVYDAAGYVQMIGAGLARSVVREPASRYFTRGDHRMHYYDFGSDDEPLILLHGLAMTANLSWVAPGITQHLHDRWRIIAPDLRGHGKSTCYYEPGAYGRELTDDLFALMDHLGVRRAHVAGYSVGEAVALKALCLHPDRFYSGVLCAAGWRPATSHMTEDLEEVASTLDAPHSESGLRGKLMGSNADMQTQFAAFMLQVIDMWNDTPAMAALMRGLPGLMVTADELRRTTVPTLGLCGDQDTLYPDARRLRSMKPNHTLLTLHDANHFTTLIAPDFPKKMRRFLARNGAQSHVSGRRRAAVRQIQQVVY